MKNLFKNLMLVAVAAMAFTACQKDNEDVNRVNETTVVEFKAEFDTTRSGFNEKDAEGYSSHWDGGETINLEVVSNGNVASPLVAPTMEADGTFTAELNGSISTEGTITALIPAGSWKSEYNYEISGYEMVPNIPLVQTPEAGSVDPAAHILKAVKTFEGGLSGVQELAFAHQVAYAKMTLDTTVAIDAIAQVIVEIDDQRYTLDPEKLTEPTFWFACKAVTPSAMTVTITDVNDTNYVKELELAGAVKPLAFTTGRVASFKVGGFTEIVIPDVTAISAIYDDHHNTFSFNVTEKNGGQLSLSGIQFDEEITNGMLPNGGKFDAQYNSEKVYWTDAKGNMTWLTNLHIDVYQEEEGYTIAFWWDTRQNGYAPNNRNEVPAQYDYEGDGEGLVYTGIITGINNPPVPAAENVTTAPESVSGRATKDAWDYTYYLSFVAGDWTIDDLYFYAPVSSNGIIPANTYTIRGGTATLTDTTWVFGITDGTGTVTVAHSGEDYVLEFAFEDANGSTYEFSYTGVIEGDGIFSPGAEKFATPTNVVATAEGKVITVTWDAVDGATSYTVNVEGLYSNTFNETTGTFEGEWDTTYTVTVVTNSDGTKLASDPATTTVTTGSKPEIPVTTVTFTQVTTKDQSDYDMGVPAVQLAFSDGGSNTLNLYVFCDSSYVLNGDATVDYVYEKGYIFPAKSDFNGNTIFGGTVNFAHDGENYTITMTGLTDESDWQDGTFKLDATYTGTIEFDGKNMGAEGGEGDEGDEGAAFVRAEYDFEMKLFAYNGGDAEYAFRLYDANDNCLEVIYELGNHTGWEDQYTVNYTKDGNTVSGYTSLQTQKPSDYNCADGEKYYVVIVTLSNGTQFEIQDQIPSTEVDLY